jgi:hypothetical protein
VGELSGWNVEAYYDLPAELAKAGIDIKLLDVWNTTSYARLFGTIMPGWDASNTFSYYWPYVYGIFTFGKAHVDPLTNPAVINEVKEVVAPPEQLWYPWLYYPMGLWY